MSNRRREIKCSSKIRKRTEHTVDVAVRRISTIAVQVSEAQKPGVLPPGRKSRDLCDKMRTFLHVNACVRLQHHHYDLAHGKQVTSAPLFLLEHLTFFKDLSILTNKVKESQKMLYD